MKTKKYILTRKSISYFGRKLFQIKAVKDFEEVLERDITLFGNSSHIIVPKKHAGKKAIVIIKNQENNIIKPGKILKSHRVYTRRKWFKLTSNRQNQKRCIVCNTELIYSRWYDTYYCKKCKCWTDACKSKK